MIRTRSLTCTEQHGKFFNNSAAPWLGDAIDGTVGLYVTPRGKIFQHLSFHIFTKRGLFHSMQWAYIVIAFSVMFLTTMITTAQAHSTPCFFIKNVQNAEIIVEGGGMQGAIEPAIRGELQSISSLYDATTDIGGSTRVIFTVSKFNVINHGIVVGLSLTSENFLELRAVPRVIDVNNATQDAHDYQKRMIDAAKEMTFEAFCMPRAYSHYNKK